MNIFVDKITVFPTMRRMVAMMLLAVFLLSGGGAGADSRSVEEIPNVQRSDARRLVSNPDGVLSERAVATMDSMLYDLKQRGVAQIAVAALASIGDADPADFALRLGTEWGVGGRERDNGMVILLVVDQRALRFETGYGLEGVLPDALCKRIQTAKMVPLLAREDWDGGMTAGVRAVYDHLNGAELDFVPQAAEEEIPVGRVLLLLVGLPLLFIGVVALGHSVSNRCRRCHKYGAMRLVSDTEVSRNAHYVTRERTKRCRYCGYAYTYKVQEPRDNGLGGGGPFPGGLGGFGGFRGGGGSFGGGFGGGSFGGGGATSRF